MVLGTTKDLSDEARSRVKSILAEHSVLRLRCRSDGASPLTQQCALEDDDRIPEVETCDQNPDGDAFRQAKWFKDLNADAVWANLMSTKQVVVAVIDDGVDLNHTAVSSLAWENQPEKVGTRGVDDDGNGLRDDIRGWNFEAGDDDICPGGACRHGTLAAGVIAQLASVTNGHIKIMPLRVMQQGAGAVPPDLLASAIRYSVDEEARVISISVRAFHDNDQLVSRALEYARDKNVLIVAAAGNVNRDLKRTPEFPAALSGSNAAVIAVQSVDPTGGSCSANYVSGIALLAASVEDLCSVHGADGWTSFGQTSAAAPIVAGVAAAIFSDDNLAMHHNPDELAAELVGQAAWVPSNCYVNIHHHRLRMDLGFLK